MITEPGLAETDFKTGQTITWQSFFWTTTAADPVAASGRSAALGQTAASGRGFRSAIGRQSPRRDLAVGQAVGQVVPAAVGSCPAHVLGDRLEEQLLLQQLSSCRLIAAARPRGPFELAVPRLPRHLRAQTGLLLLETAQLRTAARLLALV